MRKGRGRERREEEKEKSKRKRREREKVGEDVMRKTNSKQGEKGKNLKALDGGKLNIIERRKEAER